MDALSKAIRERPLSFLPGISLKMLWHFRRGYDLRRTMEGQPYEWQDDSRGLFAQWVRKHFEARGRALSHLAVISSFCSTEVEAFYRYFELLDEFGQDGKAKQPIAKSRRSEMRKISFVELVKAIRKNPERYLGYPTFLGCCAFLMGDETAHRDLGMAVDEDRVIFADFKRWVETKKNRALPRPWFKIISFWSGFCDCGHVKGGAFSLFCHWLDQYAEEIGRPGLF